MQNYSRFPPPKQCKASGLCTDEVMIRKGISAVLNVVGINITTHRFNEFKFYVKLFVDFLIVTFRFHSLKFYAV
jgi:hypothetical protein